MASTPASRRRFLSIAAPLEDTSSARVARRSKPLCDALDEFNNEH
jgi:hypothetical protein